MAFITNDTFRRATAAKVATLPVVAIGGAASVNLFSVSGGGLTLVSLYGYLSSAITGANCLPRFGFDYDPVSNGSNDDISNIMAVGWTTATPLGSMLAMPNLTSDATLEKDGSSRAVLNAPTSGRILRQDGVVRLVVSNAIPANGSLTGGQITFYAVYEPHAPGAYMVPV
jgi:hypothetical protein